MYYPSGYTLGDGPATRCKRAGKTPTSRHGVAVVEFVFVATIAFVLFFAAFEFCRVAMIRHTADNAVYEGARRGIIPGGRVEDVSNTTRRILRSVGVDDVRVTVTPATIARDTENITVAIRIPLDSNSLVPTNFFRGKVIGRSLTMRREGNR